MNKSTMITTGLVILIVALGILGFETFVSDNEGPQITIGEVDEITYTEGEDKSILLQNVTARDNRDGDVTNTVIVSRITSEGRVYYAAEDKSGNVSESKTSRLIHYIRKDIAPAEGEVTEPSKEAENNEENNEEAVSTEEVTEVSTEEETTTVSGIPVITLKASETTITSGQGFAPLDFVASTQDDSGDVSRRIRIDGNYSTTIAGDYTLSYSVTDPDGNQSEIVPFVLHVVGAEKQTETTAEETRDTGNSSEEELSDRNE